MELVGYTAMSAEEGAGRVSCAVVTVLLIEEFMFLEVAMVERLPAVTVMEQANASIVVARGTDTFVICVTVKDITTINKISYLLNLFEFYRLFQSAWLLRSRL